MRFGFCGPSYPSQSPNVDAERCINFYPETVESGQGKGAIALYPTPGLKVFATLAGEASITGLFYFNGRAFAGGVNLWELFADGTATNRGALNGTPLSPVQFAANQNELLIRSNGVVYTFNFLSNALALVDMSQFQGPVSQIGYLDGYFIATIANSNKWQVSSPLDGKTWPGIQVAAVSVFAEPIVSMVCDNRQVVLLGQKRSVAYYDSGNTFPFDVIPGGFAEVASQATWGTVQMDNTVYYLGGYGSGMTMGFKITGNSPVRVSNHAIEFQWSQYPQKAKDAIAYSYEDQGHSFWVIYFPSGNATWVYDVATASWHERTYLDPVSGVSAHLSRSHCYAKDFGKHLVGSRSSGTVYEMSIDLYDDAGTSIQRQRIAPYINLELEREFHNRFQIDLETGTGKIDSVPNVSLSWSDDGGHTYSNEHTFAWSKQGQYKTRGILWRLGYSRGRVYKATMTDAIPWRITDAYVNDPTERLTSRIRQSA